MKEIEQAAFLLHSRPYRDHQVIVEFLTEHQGKISAIAYIGKSLKSNKKALLQPFLPLNVVLKGQSNLKTLSRIEASQKSFLLTSNHLYSGFYLNELQVRLLGEHIPYNELFIHYQNSLKQLADKQSIEPILRNFEEILLDELGLTIDYLPIEELDSEYFQYLPEQGFVMAESSNKLPAFRKESLLAIAKQEFNDKTVKHSYKILMRQVLNHALGGKPLNSRKLFTSK